MKPAVVDKLEQSLNLTRSTLDIAHRRFKERHPGEEEAGDPVDSFLGFLRAEQIIDAETYRNTTAAEPVAIADARAILAAEGPQYEVFEKIAEGGMGEIRMARDRQLRHRVALKVLKCHADEASAVSRFVTEAQVTAQLDHPNIVPVYGIQSDGDQVSFAMKMVAGKTLKQLIVETAAMHASSARLDAEHSLTTRIEHFLKLCDAMSYAHSKGVLHRDLKPANIMVGAFNEVYLMDWGIARVAGESDESTQSSSDDPIVSGTHTQHTRADHVIGTPTYMSPEQASGPSAELDERSDLYCLGLVLFELVTLTRALHGESVESVLSRAADARLEPLVHRFGRSIDPELVAVIARATALDRHDRYATVADFARDLRSYLRGDAVSARPDNPVQKLARWMGKHRHATLLTTLLLLLVVAGVIIWSLRAQQLASARARAREDRLTSFQADVATRAHLIDRHFLRFEGMLFHLADKAVGLLGNGEASARSLYSNDDFANGRGPADVAAIPPYGKPISLSDPVYVLAPGVALADVEATLRRLAPIGDHYRRMLTSSREAAPHDASLAALLAGEGVPLRWVYIGLANGTMFSYPGKSGYPQGYDPRLRPWYQLVAGERSPRWGNPYIDLQGQGIVLPGVIGLYAPEGSQLGVAGVEVTFDYIIREFLAVDKSSTRASYLLDDRGRIVVSSAQLAEEFAAGELHNAMELELYPVGQVVQAMAGHRSGQLTTERGGVATVVAYQRIPTLGWYYVVEAQASALIKR